MKAGATVWLTYAGEIPTENLRSVEEFQLVLSGGWCVVLLEGTGSLRR